jgi:fibronectin type 3 domain-containing protein
MTSARPVHRLLVVFAVVAGLFAAMAAPASARPLRPPTGVTARVVSHERVSVSWQAASGASSYQVLRATRSGGPYTVVATTFGLSHDDAGLAPATTYHYVVRSKAGTKVSQNSAEVAVTTPPMPPGNVRATADLDRVELRWDAVPGVLRYDVRRSATDGTGEVVVGSTTQTSYTDTTVQPGTGYVYWIRAVWSGSSNDSEPVSVLTGGRTTTTLTVSPSPSEERQWVLLSATVEPADSTITRFGGEVAFYSGSTYVGATTVGPLNVAEIQRQVPAGSVRAEYRGDPSVPLGSSTSEPVTHAVLPPGNDPVRFAPYRIHDYGVGALPTATAVADVTGDGRADALMTTTTHSFPSDDDFVLWVFAQRADGTLAEPRKIATHGGPATTMRIAVGDVDGDGDDDVATTARDGVDLFIQGDDGLADPVLFRIEDGWSDTHIGDVRLADLDRDGRDDLVVAGLQRVAAYRSEPGGTFGEPVVIETAVRWQVEVGDLTGDGRPDVATRDRFRTVAIFAQTEDGGFVERWRQAVPTGYSTQVEAMAIGDVTGDGRADLVATVGGNVPGSRLQVYAQSAAGTLDDPVTYTAYHIPQPLALVDLNGDGRRDVTIVHGGWQTFSVLLQRPDGRLGAHSGYDLPYATRYDPRGLTVGDVTSDGKPDVVVADYNYGLVVVPQA